MKIEGCKIKTNELQVVGATTMVIASKLEENSGEGGHLWIEHCIDVTGNTYTAEEFRQMELRILMKLGFNITRPLPLHFLGRMFNVGHLNPTFYLITTSSKEVELNSIKQGLAKYLLEMSLLEYDCAHFPPSLMADAALCLSLMIIEEDASLSIWTSTLQKYSTYTADEIVPVVCKLAFVLTKRKKCQLQAVHTKYLGEKFNGVGKLKQLQRDVVTRIAKGQLNLTLTSELVREGKATDDDMRSIAGLMSNSTVILH